MKIPEEIEILEDNQTTILGGWEIDGVDKDDVPAYEGVLTMHQHFAECIEQGSVPLTDLRDVIHSIRLVDRIEGSME
jgi:predicted dehydrogenase